jgi:hypothetical protein
MIATKIGYDEDALRKWSDARLAAMAQDKRG